MTNKLPGLHRPIRGLDSRQAMPQKTAHGQNFQDILESKLQEPKLKFSAHAEARMRLRNVDLGSAQLAKLQDAVDKAKAKGARESLIIMEGNVFVVSVKNGTVITVVDGASARENVFTQIDSAVLTD
jgi:flagellar operon protein